MTGYAEGYRVWGWGDAADVPVPAPTRRGSEVAQWNQVTAAVDSRGVRNPGVLIG